MEVEALAAFGLWVENNQDMEAKGTTSQKGRPLKGKILQLLEKGSRELREELIEGLLKRRELKLKLIKLEEEAKWAAKEEKAIAEEEAKADDAKAAEETMESDNEARVARLFRDDWMAVWSQHHGSYHDTTKLRPMRFTFRPPQDYSLFPMSTLQIFSVKVAGIKRGSGLQWPLDVFGIVAVRDSIDYNRNVIFSRTRNSCQTVTKEDPYLVLAGPTRAVVWQDFLTIEVKLTVKGSTESEDKDLIFLAVPFACSQASYSYGFQCYKTSQRSTLRFALGHIARSVEATIFVVVAKGSWPHGLCGQFHAFTTGIRDTSVTSIDHEKIILLDFKPEKMLSPRDEIMLSRHVVSVETKGKLKIHAKAFRDSESGKNAVEHELVMIPKDSDISIGHLDFGFCKLEVTVAWSLISYHEHLE